MTRSKAVVVAPRRPRCTQLLVVAAASALLACHSVSGPVAAPSPRRSPLIATGHAQRVVLLSFDGLSADELTQYETPAFRSMAAHVTRVIPVTPTVTSTTHASILTGATPEKTGIVSNQFHIAGTAATQTAMGMETDIDVETLIDAARRSGKRVGCITFPTVDATTTRRTADWGLVWQKAVTPSRIVRLKQTDFHSEWLPPTWGKPQPKHASFSPVMRARLEWSVPKLIHDEVDIAAYDTTDDHVRNYDEFFAEHAGTETPLENGWFAISTPLDDGLYGSWSRILSFDPSLASMTVYCGAINRNEGYPASYVRMLDDAVGFWPGVPDETSAKKWLVDRDGLDADSFAQQAARLSDFLARATTVSMRRMQFDLLLAYQPIIDESEHQFRLVSDVQPHATPENLAAAARVRAAAYSSFDRSVSTIAAALDPARDALVVTGDHGLAAVDTEVRVNTLLVSWGFATKTGNGLAPDTHWAAYATGNVAHIYRFGGADDADALARQLAGAVSPDGAPVFERIDRKTPRSHPHGGDLVAFAYPRFALSAALGEAFVRPAYFGQHGGVNTHHEFQTALGATGAGVFAQTVDSMRQTQIARYVCDLLGIAPPHDAE